MEDTDTKKKNTTNDKSILKKQIKEYRKMIDEKWDPMIIHALSVRIGGCYVIGQAKAELGLEDVYDPKREERVLKNLKKLCKDHNISYEAVEKIYGVIFDYSKQVQKIAVERQHKK